jgi:hypothetical protein
MIASATYSGESFECALAEDIRSGELHSLLLEQRRSLGDADSARQSSSGAR